MHKYTSGPWWVYDNGYRYPGIESMDTSIVIHGMEPESERGIGGKDKEQSIANARLIAAAPDLLEACQLIVDADEYQSVVIATEAIKAAKVAIEQAIGESS